MLYCLDMHVQISMFNDTMWIVIVWTCLQSWAAYEGNDLLRMVDPMLKMNYPKEEAKRFLMVGLCCVQETTRTRPRMSEVVNMLSNNTEMGEFHISRPGFVNDMRNLKMKRQLNSLEESSATAATFADSSGWSTSNLAR